MSTDGEILAALDIETTGLDPWKDEVLGIGLWAEEFNTYFESLGDFSRFLDENPRIRFVMHVGSFDTNFLRRKGVDLRKRWRADTRSLASLLYPSPSLAEGQKRPYGLENLAIQYLGETPYKLDRENMSSYSPEQVRDYCLDDCRITWNLYKYLIENVKNQSRQKALDFVDRVLHPATLEAANIEYNGISINWEELDIYRKQVAEKLSEVLKQFTAETKEIRADYRALKVREVIKQYDKKREQYLRNHQKADIGKTTERYQGMCDRAISKIPEFSLSSPTQVAWLLKELGMDIVNPLTGKESTGKEVLKLLEGTTDNKIVNLLLESRKLEKLLTSNIPNLVDNRKEDNRVHSRINIGGTRTGRVSSSAPNSQQITRGKLRECVVASSPDKVLFCGDYSQLEVRILAQLAKEEKLLHVFKNDEDPYSLFAKEMFGLKESVTEIANTLPLYREAGKLAVLSVLYRTGAKKLSISMAKVLGRKVSVKECWALIQKFKDGLPTLQQYDAGLYSALTNQKIFYNLLGRPFRIEDNSNIYMKGLNTLVQGSASDLVIYGQTALVLPELDKQGVEYETKLWVHDEVVIELNKEEADQVVEEIIAPGMTSKLEESLELDVPLKLKYTVSNSWEKAT